MWNDNIQQKKLIENTVRFEATTSVNWIKYTVL
jgi:hypothetical protein